MWKSLAFSMFRRRNWYTLSNASMTFMHRENIVMVFWLVLSTIVAIIM